MIDAAVSGDYAWRALIVTVWSSRWILLRVVATMWRARELEVPTVPRRRVKPVSGWSPGAT